MLFPMLQMHGNTRMISTEFVVCDQLIMTAVKQLPSYRTHSATLPRSEPLPTTTTGHYTTCCKKPQSCAPEDG